MIKYFYFVLLLNYLFPCSLFAGDLLENIVEKANQYYDEENYQEAMKWYTKAAKQNHPEAQFMIGIIFFNEENYKEAFKWFLLSAKQNYSRAQYHVAKFYLDGDSIESDDDMALFWLLKTYNIQSTRLTHKYRWLRQMHVQQILNRKKKTINSFFEN